VIHTDDLFLGALALVRGGELEAVEVHGTNSRRMAFFRIVGPAAGEAEREYYRGPTSVDLRLLKSEVRRLKDKAFEAMRQEERRDASQQGRDRASQGGERAERGHR